MDQHGQSRWKAVLGMLTKYLLGPLVGPASAIYGIYALLSRQAAMLGLHGENSTVTGLHAIVVAVAYLAGGVYLTLRFSVHPRTTTRSGQNVLYLAENCLLLVLIAALGYVLLKVGTAG